MSLEVLKPIAKRVLETLWKSAKKEEGLMILMDRSMINDTLNLLWISALIWWTRLAVGLGVGAARGQF